MRELSNIVTQQPKGFRKAVIASCLSFSLMCFAVWVNAEQLDPMALKSQENPQQVHLYTEKSDKALLYQAVTTTNSVQQAPSNLGSNRPGEADRKQSISATATKISVTRGRSQIIKFAQPIARLSIAEPSLIDLIPLSPNEVMVNGKLRGVTSLIVWDADGNEGIFDLYVENDTSELLQTVEAIAPGEDIRTRITDDSFIVSGKVSNTIVLDEIRQLAGAYGYREEKFVDLTETPAPQVLLEVRVAEATKIVAKNLRTSFGFNGGSLTASRFPDPVVNNPITTFFTDNSGGFNGTIRFNKYWRAAWETLETEGKINTLANPTLVCTHGRTASFLAGGEFPFIGAVDQNGSPIISFKEFGVKLNFIPWISVRSRRIEINVEPEVSTLDTSNCITTAGIPVCGLLKRTTNTTVDLADGETLMISGILSREDQGNYSMVPFIGRIPIIGNLFKDSAVTKTDRELVVVITPHIVDPIKKL